MSDRLEREIEEILRKMDSAPAPRPFPSRLRRMSRRWGVGFHLWPSGLGLRITPTKVMVLSLVLFGLSVFLRAGLRQWSFYVGLLAIALFITAIVMSAKQGRGMGHERRWRGQVVDLPDYSLWGSLREWWLRQKRKFRL